jgi:hypothetical protein
MKVHAEQRDLAGVLTESEEPAFPLLSGPLVDDGGGGSYASHLHRQVHRVCVRLHALPPTIVVLVKYSADCRGELG